MNCIIVSLRREEIEHEMDYAQTAERYPVSYQQIYQWTRKYQSNGVEGLIDKRGKRKPENEMSELQRLRAKNKFLQAEKRKAEREGCVLKKLGDYQKRLNCMTPIEYRNCLENVA